MGLRVLEGGRFRLVFWTDIRPTALVAKVRCLQAARADAFGRVRSLPLPRQQLFELAGRVLGDAGEDVSEPGLRINVRSVCTSQSGYTSRGAALRRDRSRRTAMINVLKPKPRIALSRRRCL